MSRETVPSVFSLRGGVPADRWGRLVVLLALLTASIWILWFFSELAFFLIISGLVAYLLGPIADFFQRMGTGRTVGVLMTFVFVAAVVVIGFASMVPFIEEQVIDLAKLLSPEVLRQATASIEETLRHYVPMPEGAVDQGLANAIEALFRQERISNAFSYTIDLFTNILYALLVIPLVTFFLMKDGRDLTEAVVNLVPNRYFELTVDLIESIRNHLGRYFRALLVRDIVVAVLATVLLSGVGLRYASVVGIFAGLANTIPYFGPLLGLAAAIIVGVAQTGDLVLFPGIFAAIFVTQIVDNVLQPFIFSRAIRIHPLVILCTVIIGAEVGGIIGMLLAIPVITVLWVTAKSISWSIQNYKVFRISRP